MKNLTKDSFEQDVLNQPGAGVVDFWATWCGPCQMRAPVLEEVARELPQVQFCKVDVDEERELALSAGIESIPTLLVIKNGRVEKRLVGYREKDALRRESEAVL